MFEIRKATQRDARAIRALIFEARINPIGLNWRRFLVAVDEKDQVIGCGQIKPHRDGILEMASIAVQTRRQNQGIGTAVIHRLLSENNPPLYLTCRASMQPYYEKFGFRTLRQEEMPPYYRRIYRMFSFFKKIIRRTEDLRVMAIGLQH